MSRTGEEVDALGLVARTLCNDLMELMAQPGAVWLLSDVAYPSNVGTIIRSAEVTGAVGVVVDGNFNRPARQRAKRVAMRADRFISVLWEDSKHTVLAAQQAGRRVVAVESTGELAPWDVDLTGSVLLIVGGERTGIGDEVLGMANAVVRLPCPGFIPSWNVQAAVAAVAGERLRQQRAASGD
jgi:TrmH family RNA methyltransferase